MAIDDWTRVVAVGAAFTQEVSGAPGIPLAGSASWRLRLDDTGGGSGGAATHGVCGITSGGGVTTGTVRTIALLNNFTGNVAWGSVFGMMQGSIGLSSQAYWATFRGTGSDVHLVKGAVTSLFSGATLKSEAHGLSLARDSPFTIQLEFQTDPDSGVVVLTVSVGEALDFSDLAEIFQFTDNASPFSSGVSMGIGGRIDTGNIAVRDIYHDTTELDVP